jgi:2'-5' RNA ligase
MPRIRTFVAIETTDDLRRRAGEVSARLHHVGGDWKWVTPANLHWTLHFLGDVEELEIPAVCTAVATAAGECEPFELTAVGAGAFPSADRPRTIWIGAGQGADAMVALQRGIERRLKKLGYRGDNRRFVPHLTLGRAGRHGRPPSLSGELSALSDFDAGSMLVNEVIVFSSQLTGDGPSYDPLARAPLAP